MRLLMSFALATALSWPLAAQQATDLADQIRACQAIIGDAERLACFNALVVPGMGGKATSPTAPRAPVNTEKPKEASPPKPTPPPADATPRASTPAPETPGVARDDEFGASDLKRNQKTQNKTAKSITVGVTDSGKNNAGRYFFFLDNGQVWRQIRGDSSQISLPRSAYSVRIKKGFLGAHFLNVEGRTPRIRVERLR